MRLVAGIDIGSGVTKAVIRDDSGRVAGRGQCSTGVHLEKAAQQALAQAAAAAGVSPLKVSYVATTGMGRYSLSTRDIQITEITSAAAGASELVAGTLCVLDIGSQCTRAIAVQNGKVRTFKTNDKCAAGSGSFILRAAKYLQVDVSEVGMLALKATNPQPISSVCAVLAESEIINHVSSGVAVEDILRGIYDSLAERAAGLLRRVGTFQAITFIGGVALQRGMVSALEARLKLPVTVPQDPQFVCATGAAGLALRRLQSAMNRPVPSLSQRGSWHASS